MPNFPIMEDIDGREITVEYTTNISNAKAVANGTHHYIIMNPDYMDNYMEDVQMFIFYHEYAHILVGHTDGEWSFRNKDDLQREADCVALTFVDTPNVRKYLKSIGREVKTCY
jgi:hypothetical protein